MGNSISSNAELEQELLRRVAANDFARVRNLIEVSRVNVNCTDENGITPLMFAVVYDRVRVARFLIGKKATTVDAVDNEECTALGCAMIRNNVAMSRLLLESRRANVDQQFQEGGGAYSPLGYAIVYRNGDMVRLLLQFDANTVETLVCGKTLPALHIACRYSRTEIVRLLLGHNDGVNVNKQIRWGGKLMTPLCWACESNNIEKAQLLVEEHGAQVIFPGRYPDAPFPLAVAIIYGSMELIQFLLGKLPQGDNSAALSYPLETALRKNKLEVAQLLVDHGADVNGQPYLYMCAANWHGAEGVQDRVSFLLEKGADVNMTNNFGQTPLFAAAENGSVALVKMLLKAGANVNIRSNWRGTPLQVAHSKGHLDVVYLLLRESPHVWPRLKTLFEPEPPTDEPEPPTDGQVLLGGMLIVWLVFLVMQVTW